METDNMQNLMDMMEEVSVDYYKAKEGNKRAGIRSRKKLIEANKLINDLKKEILSFYKK